MMRQKIPCTVRKTLFALLGGLGLFLYASCSGHITGQLAQDASGTLQIQAGLEPNMISLINTLRSLGPAGTQQGPILDAGAFNSALQTAPGVRSAALRNSGREKIAGTISVNRIGDLFLAGNGFIRYEGDAVSGKVSVHVDRATGSRILPLISAEAVDYLSALMAPVATGEALTKKEYLELVTSVYGEAIAAEIAAARIGALISVPGTVSSVKGGSFSGREARFDIPLLDILVLETPLNYEIAW
ncbi:MAG: hypothetical protein LBP60_03320 [Spirochaetaceae bacterium]|jgi:hypothetical protein|nr:hypothetical protein [Spirochaetaceae bacterium]